MPEVAPPDECPPMPPGPDIPMRARYETRLAIGGPLFAEGPAALTGGWIRLQPANAAMQPIRLQERDVLIQGVVVGVMRKY